jgi:glutathione S-transferase
MVYCANARCAEKATEGQQYCQQHAGGALTLYYWPVLGRVNAALRMLEESKTPYTQKSEFPEIASIASGYGANTDTFAPPILQDGEIFLSQSAPVVIHVAKRTGFDQGVECSHKALQYMLDVNDFAEGFTNAAKSVETVKAFINAPEGGGASPADEWLRNIERSIKGPYYFGARPTYVDFWLTQAFDWGNLVLFSGLPKCIAENYPKVKGVLAGIRGLESAKALEKLPVGPPYAALKPEIAAALKE